MTKKIVIPKLETTLSVSTAETASPEPHKPEALEATALKILSALASMAMRSQRHEAELSLALRMNRLTLPPDQIESAIRYLLAERCIARVVPLNDGGLLVVVTDTGFGRVKMPARR